MEGDTGPTPLELMKLYHRAESALKRAEQASDSLVIPAVNELRYAGRHIVDALCPKESGKEPKVELNEAKTHIERAIYDSVEVSAVYYLGKIRNFQETYSTIPITEHLPEYKDYIRKYYEILDFIGDNNRRDPSNEYEKLEGYSDELCSIWRALEAISEELNKVLLRQSEANAKVLREQQRSNIAIGIAAISMLIAVAALFIK